MGTLKKPAYINDDALIKTILTKNKINSHKDYTFFTKLCSLNTSRIQFDIAMQLSEFTGDELTFLNYLGRFVDKKLMVIRYNFKLEGVKPDYLFICDENSFEFIYEYINECITHGRYDSNHPLPSFKEFTYHNINIPKERIEPFSTHILREKLHGRLNDTLTIYSIPIYKDLFYCTDENIDKICDYAITKLQYIFNSSFQVTNEILKLFKNDTLDFQDNITSKEYSVWNAIVQKIDKFIPELRANKKVSDSNNFLDFVLILKTSVEIHSTFIEEKTQTESNMNNLKQELEEFLLTQTEGISKEEYEVYYTQLIEKYKLEDEKERLHAVIQKLVRHARDFEPNQPVHHIIDFEIFLIHSSLLPICISSKYFLVSKQINILYLDIMKRFLIHKLSPKERVFFDIEQLEGSVRQNVQNIDKFMYTMLHYPIVIANMIINNHNKKTLDNSGKNNEENKSLFNQMSLSKQLSTFFNLRTKKLLNWYEIFNINIVQLAQKSFSQLSFFQKILLLVTNRYNLTKKKIQKINTSLTQNRDDLMENLSKTQKFIQK